MWKNTFEMQILRTFNFLSLESWMRDAFMWSELTTSLSWKEENGKRSNKWSSLRNGKHQWSDKRKTKVIEWIVWNLKIWFRKRYFCEEVEEGFRRNWLMTFRSRSRD